MFFITFKKKRKEKRRAYLINSFVTGSEAGIQTIFLAANPVESSVPFTFLCRGTRQSMLHKQQSGFDVYEFFQLT